MQNTDPSFYDVDEHDLIGEARSHSKRMFEMSSTLAEAEADAKQADVLVELVEAELDKAIRSNPEAFGLKKISENAVKNAIKLTKKWQKAKERCIEAEKTRDIFKGGVEALKHRKDMIGNVVYLRGQNYYSDPVTDSKIQRKHRKESDRESEKVLSNMSKALNKRKD